MANNNRGSDGLFFSPASGLSDLPSPGGLSNPSQPSIYPDIDMTDKGGDSPTGTRAAEEYAGMSPDHSAGNSPGVSLFDGPETTSADLGNQLAGGLGDVPKPSGSY